MVQYLCQTHGIDVAVLAEDSRTINDVFPGVSAAIYDEYAPVPSSIRYFLKRGVITISPISDDKDRQSIREITVKSGLSILVAAVHLPSKLRADDNDQYLAARQLRRSIELAEKKVGHDRTIVIGDMNMNPFERGMSAADGLHGVMDKQVAQKLSRVVGGEQFKFFYNPMWSRLGDESSGPAGTYYRGADGVESPFWHTFDQALLRPCLISAYANGSLNVITQIGSTPLLTALKLTPSDHLPIVLRLNV